MNYPSPLYAGDTIGLIAPCSPVPKESLSACVKAVHSLGFYCLLGDSVYDSLHGYLAGSDELRARDINQMFGNPEVHGIFCLRGGYGSTRIMDALDYELIRHHPKLFIGYSDVTSFHLAFHSLCSLVTFHGPMVCANMADNFDSYSRDSLLQAISMPKRLYFNNPIHYPYEVIVPGKCSGRIIGGCLSLVSPAVGTFYEPDYTGKILFLEDVDETLPRCDKLMWHLKNSGILSRVNGVVLGAFKDCTNPRDPSYTMPDYFRDFFADYNKPVLYNVLSCHEKPMGTIPFGTMCTIDTSCCHLSFSYC